MADPSRKSLAEEAKKMRLWTQKFKRVDHCKVKQFEDEYEDELNDNEIWVSCAPREEPSGRPIKDQVARSKAKQLMEDKIKTAVEVPTRIANKKTVEK